MRFDRGYLRPPSLAPDRGGWPARVVRCRARPGMRPRHKELLERAAAADVGRLRDGDALSVPGLRALGEPDLGIKRAASLVGGDGGRGAVDGALDRSRAAKFSRRRPDHLPAIVVGEIMQCTALSAARVSSRGPTRRAWKARCAGAPRRRRDWNSGRDWEKLCGWRKRRHRSANVYRSN